MIACPPGDLWAYPNLQLAWVDEGPGAKPPAQGGHLASRGLNFSSKSETCFQWSGTNLSDCAPSWRPLSLSKPPIGMGGRRSRCETTCSRGSCSLCRKIKSVWAWLQSRLKLYQNQKLFFSNNYFFICISYKYYQTYTIQMGMMPSKCVGTFFTGLKHSVFS